MVFLSYGIPFNPDGYAINDFEGFNDGEVDNLNVDLQQHGDVIWLDSETFRQE